MVTDKENRATLDRRQLGSPEDFEREWRTALAGEAPRYFIYPVDTPTTQFELFEQVKAQHVCQSLQTHNLPNGLVLEYGCGSAGMSAYLAQRGYRVVASDLSINALKVAALNAHQHLTPEAHPRFHKTAGDTFALPFADATFDVVMSYGLLEHFGPEALDKALREISRTLRPGGMFIADIVHGRFSVRQVGVWLSLIASLLFHAATFRWQKLRMLPKAYLSHYFENDLDEHAWAQALTRAGLTGVQVRICHPYSPLALSGWSERFYVRLLTWGLPLWRWFDQTQPTWGRYWGWLYLAEGIKPADEVSAEAVPQ